MVTLTFTRVGDESAGHSTPLPDLKWSKEWPIQEGRWGWGGGCGSVWKCHSDSPQLQTNHLLTFKVLMVGEVAAVLGVQWVLGSFP